MSDTRILLIDDHAVVRAGLRKALEDVPGITVVGEAADGAQVNQAIEQHQPNCLLIDVTMPNFEPISAIKGIRLRYPELKILVVSAYDDDVYVQGLLSAGVNGYHLKDQPLSDLQLAVQRVMDGQRWVTGRLLDTLLQGQSPPPTPPTINLPSLTRRQRSILALLQDGYDNQRIANDLGISIKTVENHLTRLYRQLNVQSRLEAVNLARQHPTLMAKQPAITRPNPPPADFGLSSTSSQGTILIVDDNGRFRHQLRRTLAKITPNARIGEAATSADALRQVESDPPQLIFVDVVLGNEDGVNCTRQLKRVVPDSRIILMTAYPDREFRQRGMTAGAAALLDKKDLDSNVLRGIVQDTLGR